MSREREKMSRPTISQYRLNSMNTNNGQMKQILRNIQYSNVYECKNPPIQMIFALLILCYGSWIFRMFDSIDRFHITIIVQFSRSPHFDPLSIFCHFLFFTIPSCRCTYVYYFVCVTARPKMSSAVDWFKLSIESTLVFSAVVRYIYTYTK